MVKKFEFLANVKDLSQHCIPREDKNECFVQFKLGAYKRLGTSFSGLVLKFGKETWDRQCLKDVLLPRGVYKVTIEPVEKDLLSFLHEKKRDAGTSKQDESTYYVLKENPGFIPNLLKFFLHFYEKEYVEDWNGQELTTYTLDVKKTYRFDVLHEALDRLLRENAFETWESWYLREYKDYHEGVMGLYEKKSKMEEECLMVKRFIPFLVRAFSYPLKSALIARFDQMQDGMDQIQGVIKKARKKKRKKRS